MQIRALYDGESNEMMTSEIISTSHSLRRLSDVEPYHGKMTTETSNNIGIKSSPEPTTKANRNVKVFVILSQTDSLQVSFTVENGFRRYCF